MIIVAALAILLESIRKWMAGLELENQGAGTPLLVLAGMGNAVPATISCVPAEGRIRSFSRRMENTSWPRAGPVLG